MLALVLAHSGHSFYSTSQDKSVRCWDLNTGVCLRHMSPHQAAVTCAVVTRDDCFLVSSRHVRNQLAPFQTS